MRRQDVYYIIACVTLILAILYVRAHSKEERIPLLQSLENLPQEFNGFVGVNDFPSDQSFYDPSADKRISRIYTKKGEDKPIHIFIGFWESQNENKRINPPRYTSQGWEYYWIKTKPISLGSNNIVKVKEFLNEKGQEKELVYYCYILNGRIISDEYQLRLLNVINSLFYGKNNAALLRVSVPVTGEFPLENAEVYGENFINAFLPLLRNYLPE